MDTIFAGATQVIAWLGKSQDNSDIAMESLPDLLARLKGFDNLAVISQDNCHTLVCLTRTQHLFGMQ
jgi:hypothetical protein